MCPSQAIIVEASAGVVNVVGVVEVIFVICVPPEAITGGDGGVGEGRVCAPPCLCACVCE